MRKKLIAVLIMLGLIIFPATGEPSLEELWRMARNYNELKMIRAYEAWDLFNGYYEEHKSELNPVRVGLVDNSVYTCHEDLKFAGTNMNLDGEKLSQEYAIAKAAGAETKKYYHGTHVAGIMGAIFGNDIGIDGMYPLACESVDSADGTTHYKSNMYASCNIGWQDVHTEREYTKGEGYILTLNYLLSNGVKVINMSTGYDEGFSQEDARQVGKYLQGILDGGQDFIIIKSAGNDGKDIEDSVDFAKISKEEFPEVNHRIVFVGNTQTDYTLADGLDFSFEDGFEEHTTSNYGSRVDIVAPGENICSTMPDGSYHYLSGTSMAAPFVAGTAAMMWTVDPSATGAMIKEMLLASAPLSVTRKVDVGNDPRKVISNFIQPFTAPEGKYHLLDAYEAVKLAIDNAKLQAGKNTPEPTKIHINTLPPLSSERSVSLDSFEDFIREVLVPRYGTIPQYTLYQSEDRSDRELGGMINAHIGDFDNDGEDELLVSRFHNEPGWEGDDELFLTVEMYERDAGGIYLQDDRTLLVPGISEVMGLYGSEISAFIYRHDGQTRIAFDTFFGINENSVTVAIYSYDGEGFNCEADICHEAYGSGDILVRYTGSEPGPRHTLSGVEWRILLEDANEPWETLDRYSSEEHNWEMPSLEEEEWLAGEYWEMLAQEGIPVREDCRILKDRLPDDATGFEYDDQYNQQFIRDLQYVYGASENYEMLWQILSWQPLGGELMLERKDYGDLLAPYANGENAGNNDEEQQAVTDYDANWNRTDSEADWQDYETDDESGWEGYDDGESALTDRLMETYSGDGELLSFGYADYDGDGRMEAFALMGVYNDETFENTAELWYVCADYAMQCELPGGCYPFDCYVTTQQGRTCFHVSEGYFGSGGAERWWTASDEVPYLLSGEYMLNDLEFVHE